MKFVTLTDGEDALPQKLRERIKQSDLRGGKSRESGGKFSGLICPVCGHAEAWAYSDRPFSIKCNRKSKCGERVRTLEFFPEVKGVEEGE